MSKNFNFIEVCAGAGGLSSGFINTGFKPILLNDNNKNCCETLKLNHKNINVFNGSMLDIDCEKYKNKIDILMGGVPCQAFSQAGKRKGIKDDRGKLFLHFIKMIDEINPKIFLIENVKGLLSLDKGKTFKYILNEFEKINKYNIKYKVLNANDYGVAQNRLRLIIIGVHKNIKKEFSFPKIQDYKPILKDVLMNCPKSEGSSYNKLKADVLKLVPQGGCWIDLPKDVQKSYMGASYNSGGGRRGIAKRLDMNKPCLTILCSPQQKQTERCHPLETRPLQILESARIQSFPDNYKFYGSLAQKYKQIGNAVPPKMAKVIAEEVYKVLQ
tara:strand:- start:710 stop:1693 length:984 start_codon:yes stop_codon:yes gene_type:complete